MVGKNITLGWVCFVCSNCTGQLPGSFRLAQQEQTFSAQQDINTKIDLLWVVDNSASMDVSQQKLRNGFSGFAQKYMQPTWDIRVAVITTDIYLAHKSFFNYLNKMIPKTPGWKSTYIGSRLGTFVNPSWNPDFVNLVTGAFDAGVLYGELVPVWNQNYAKLLPSLHDGPIPALCSELMPYFLKGPTQCATRDDQTKTTGAEKCISPDASKGESSVVECVNTVENNTIHSGRAIISTLPPKGTPADLAWSTQLIRDFMINVSTGSAGHGSERGLGSVLQLLEDNEHTDTAFFRKDSLRGIIFVSDEEDQTQEIPDSPDSDFSPQTYYKCDQASLENMNPSVSVSGNNGYCCSDLNKNCTYGSRGTSCPVKTVDGFSYRLSICADETKLIAVSEVKTKIDDFFKSLDGSGSSDPSYFVISIVPSTSQAIQEMQQSRDLDDQKVGALKSIAVDRGDRYIQLGNLVGNNSLSMNIAEENYSVLLDEIGKTIIEKKSTFTLGRAPTSVEDMIVKILHEDGTTTVIGSDKFIIKVKSLVISDQALVLSFKSTDKISINYQPKTIF